MKGTFYSGSSRSRRKNILDCIFVRIHVPLGCEETVPGRIEK